MSTQVQSGKTDTVSMSLHQGPSRYSFGQQWVKVAVLVLSMAVSGVNAQIPGTPDLCSCSPTVFTFTISYASTCEDTTIVKNGGISDTSCFATALVAEDPSDRVPVSIDTITILELNDDPDSAVINSTILEGSFNDGDTVEYASISTYGNLTGTYFPFGLQVTLRGLNSAGFPVINTWGIEYTNDCSFEPVFEADAQIGWTVFTSTKPPLPQYCPANATPTIAPTMGTTAITPTISPSIPVSDAPSSDSADSFPPSEAPVVNSTGAPTAANITAPTEAPVTAAPVNTPTEAPVPAPTETPVTEAPVTTPTEAPVTEAPVTTPTEAPVTEAPVTIPTEAPVTAPTEAPVSETPVTSPTEAPVTTPTEAPVTEAPVTNPTEVPVTAPTEAPVSEAPVTSPTEAPVTAPTEAPVTKAPVTTPTETPVTAPTEAPVTEAPVTAPTKAPISAPVITEAPAADPTEQPVANTPISPPTGPEPTPAPVPKETMPPDDMSMSYSMSMSMSFYYGDARMLLKAEALFEFDEEELVEFGRPLIRRER